MFVKLLAAATLVVGAFAASSVTPNRTATVDPTVAIPTCCMKKAYCCSVTPKRACCKNNALFGER